MDLKTKKECVLPKFVSNSKPVTPKDSQIRSYSLYKKPVDSQSKLSGNSRAWGDASPEVKSESIKSLLEESMKRGFSKAQASFVLGTSFVESGFNPDAAASTTSAGGLGQLVNKTAKACGAEGMDKFDIKEGAAATVRYLKNIYDGVVKRNDNLSQDDLFVETYGRYHDGGIVSDETMDNIARKRVLPLVTDFENYIGELEDAGELEYKPTLDKAIIEEDKEYRKLGCVL